MSPLIDVEAERAEVGRRLGYDLFRYQRCGALERLSGPVREGFQQARAAGSRTQLADRFVRKWLQLRCNAHHRNKAFGEQITPSFIESINVAVCPVLRVALTHGERAGTDWSVDRLNNDGAYAINNLAVISRQANSAKANRSYEEVFALSNRETASAGLQPSEWLRLAALMLGPCFADRSEQAPSIPLAAPIPAFSVRLALQQIQHVFTALARTQSGKNLLIKHFKCATVSEPANLRLRAFAETFHCALKGVNEAHDAWLQQPVMAALLRWRDSLDRGGWARAGAISSTLAGSHVVPAVRLATWQLATRGYSY